MIFTLSTLDAVFTLLHLENGAFELNPLMEQIIQSGFQSVVIIKSLGIGLIGWFLAIHQNFKISFYGMHVLAAIYIILSAYHLACTFLFQVI
jgi:ABC-type transporter Mla maintaining outer membrane lipid asymmetry permease subunit MlaE